MINKYYINGGKNLAGTIKISGSKNVATKAVIAACLTDEPVVLSNVPQITDIDALLEVIKSIGGDIQKENDRVTIQVKNIKNNTISLAEGAKVRTSSMFLAPLLSRVKSAIVPNPEGCRLGARSIERHIEGLEKMGAKIEYKSEDGYYHASTEGLRGINYRFEKNTHTGTETLIMAAVLADGTTLLENAAEEHEIDDLILLLNKMGAKIKRVEKRKIEVIGVERLHGVEHRIISDSNELVTFAVLSMLTSGQIFLKDYDLKNVKVFLDEVKKCGGDYEETEKGVRFFKAQELGPTNITTSQEPGFKTDWQGPWAILMTGAKGESTIHETIYENRFGYVSELKKMGAKIEYFDPQIDNPDATYNFNYEAGRSYKQAIRIHGSVQLHNGILNVSDLRAGATVVIGALIASGQSIVNGTEHIERGYEKFSQRLATLGADIKETQEIF